MAKLLIIEDDQLLNEAYKEKLSPLYDIRIAIDGESGWKEWLDWKPDAVLLDIYMPGKLDGMEVLKVAKADERTAETPVIVLTNLPDVEEKALELGAKKCMMKTDTDLQKLSQEIDSVLGR